jgi:hypothetical protein
MSPTVGRGVSHPRREIRVDGLSAREFEFECWPRARVSMVLGVWESVLSFFFCFFQFPLIDETTRIATKPSFICLFCDLVCLSFK